MPADCGGGEAVFAFAIFTLRNAAFKYELAASLLESSGDRFAQSESVAKFKRLIYLKLMSSIRTQTPSNSFSIRPKRENKPRRWLLEDEPTAV
jgi:hypothetical protein